MQTKVKPITPLLMILPSKLLTDNPNLSIACPTPVVSIYNNKCDRKPGPMNIRLVPLTASHLTALLRGMDNTGWLGSGYCVKQRKERGS